MPEISVLQNPREISSLLLCLTPQVLSWAHTRSPYGWRAHRSASKIPALRPLQANEAKGARFMVGSCGECSSTGSRRHGLASTGRNRNRACAVPAMVLQLLVLRSRERVRHNRTSRSRSERALIFSTRFCVLIYGCMVDPERVHLIPKLFSRE